MLALSVPSINGSTTGGGRLSCHAAHHRWTGYCEQAGVEIDIHQLRHTHATELINNGISIEADAGLGLTPASSASAATPPTRCPRARGGAQSPRNCRDR
ncbi:tyrosine-type recombinase/integrase [Microtetraspora fusca]|uniref:tyrosine-type recombinase/integrase n=1 Tax=Microtetraspora fusca TaxID=1997 RepID=UPI000A06A150|nr:tyrosine-type recombinase/integrase [Microtetraspora fusca]